MNGGPRRYRGDLGDSFAEDGECGEMPFCFMTPESDHGASPQSHREHKQILSKTIRRSLEAGGGILSSWSLRNIVAQRLKGHSRIEAILHTKLMFGQELRSTVSVASHQRTPHRPLQKPSKYPNFRPCTAIYLSNPSFFAFNHLSNLFFPFTPSFLQAEYLSKCLPQ